VINLELFCCHLLWFLSLLISQNWKQCMTWLWCVIYFLILHFKEINNYLHFDDSELVIVVKFMWGCDVQFSVDWNSWCKVEQESWKIDRCKAWIMHMLDQSLFFERTVGVLCIVIILCLYVCLSVCPLLCLKISCQKLRTSRNFLCVLTTAQSSSEDTAVCYVLLVLWMTSCCHLTSFWREDNVTV